MWCPFAEHIPSPNFTPGRAVPIIGAMQHTTVGSWTSALAELTRPDASPVSATFLIGLDGRIAQLVDTDDTAWAQLSCNPAWLSIEHVDDGNHADAERTPEQYAASARVNRWCADVYRYKPSSTTIVPHKKCVNTACPSGLDLPRIIIESNGGVIVPTQAEWEQHLADEANTATAVKALLNPIATWVFNAPNRPLGMKGRRSFEKALAILDAAAKPRTVRRVKPPTKTQVRRGHGKG